MTAQIQNVPYYDALRLGLVRGHVATNVQGQSTKLSTSTQSCVDVAQLTLVYPSAATALDIASTSADDTAAGTGARTVRVIGLDANYLEIYEDIALSGQTVVTTTGAFLRINAILVTTAGAGATNAGDIYAAETGTSFSAGVPVSAINVCTAGLSQTRSGVYTTPADTKTLALHVLYSAGEQGQVSAIVETRPMDGSVWYNALDIYVPNGSSGFYETRAAATLAGGTDIRIRASCTVSNGIFRVSFAGTQKLYTMDARTLTNVG